MNHPELAQPAPRQGGGALKWILLGCGGILLLIVAFFAITGYAVYHTISSDPAKVDAMAQEILTFEKPAGLKAATSVSMMGFKMATYATEDPRKNGSTVLMLASWPAGTQTKDQFQQQFDANMKQQGYSLKGAERLPNETFQVRGNDVTAQVSAVKDQNSDSRTRHYLLIVESASKKTVMIGVSGPEKTIDHAWVQKFLDTVK